MIGAILGKLERVERVDQLMGTGVGDRPYLGVVRRADTPDAAIAALRAGEVLVVPFTTPTYNVVLPLAGALVTAEGGPLSHAAVLARELGISAVVGAKGALDLESGTTVRVDPANNTVVILES
jgi:phosphohistidine swiveling domain-containing protein